MHELEDVTIVESAVASTRKPETMFQEMVNAIGDSLGDLASSDDEQDGEDKEHDEDDAELGKLSDHDEPGWLMGTISKAVRHRMESVRQKQMWLDELTQLGWGEAANYFRETDMKHGTAELKVLPLIKPQIVTTAPTTPPTRFGEHMQALDIVRGQQMPAVTTRPRSGQMMLGSEKPH